jgi:hypothetical protein
LQIKQPPVVIVEIGEREQALYAKLGVTSRTEVIQAGVRQGRVVM